MNQYFYIILVTAFGSSAFRGKTWESRQTWISKLPLEQQLEYLSNDLVNMDNIPVDIYD